ncbi:MAG: DUF2520 domain-containing protein [Deltaproteobacteria bacterium]|nr:DUF2520 domain-containing protein [Deltaproteobacteria bacterium]
MAPERLVVAGTGRAGTGVGLALKSAGLNVTFITTGGPGLIAGIRAIPADDPSAPMDVDWVLLAVPDRLIPESAALLADAGIAARRTMIGHLSGALPSSVIVPENAFACTFSAHPVFSFPLNDPPMPMPEGVVVMIETESDRGGRIARLFQRIGARTATLRAEDKPLYHAAAVMCANLPMSLVYEAAAIFDECGVPDPETTAVRLLQSVINNQMRNPGAVSITGPFVRADSTTIDGNLKALAQRDPQGADMYRVLGERLANLLFQNEILSEESWKTLDKTLK